MSKLYHHVPLRTSQHTPHNVNVLHTAQMSVGDRVADVITAFVGSWPFLLLHALWFTGWIAFRVEPFPYGLLTMIVSLEAIFLTTLVMMSQNRQAAKDRLQADEDYHTNVKAEHEVLQVLSHLDAQDVEILKIVGNIEQMMGKSEKI